MKIELYPIKEQDVIRAALAKDFIYQGCYKTKNLNNAVFDTTIMSWFLVLGDGVIMGLIFLTPLAHPVYVYHGGVYKEFRKYSHKLLKETVKLFKNLGIELITASPERNKILKRLMSNTNFQKSLAIPTNLGDVNIYTEVK